MLSRKPEATNYPGCVCLYAFPMWCACALPLCDVVGGEVSLHRELSVLFCSWQRHGSTTAVNPTVIWLTPTENNASLKWGGGGAGSRRGFRTSEGPAEQLFPHIQP